MSFFRNFLRKRESKRAVSNMYLNIEHLQKLLHQTNPSDRTRCRSICDQIKDYRTAILKAELLK